MGRGTCVIFLVWLKPSLPAPPHQKKRGWIYTLCIPEDMMKTKKVMKKQHIYEKNSSTQNWDGWQLYMWNRHCFNKSTARPTVVPDSGLLCDLLWADPSHGSGWGESDRGVSFTFGADAWTKNLKSFVTGYSICKILLCKKILKVICLAFWKHLLNELYYIYYIYKYIVKFTLHWSWLF